MSSNRRPPPVSNNGGTVDNDLNMLLYAFIILLMAYALALVLGYVSTWVYAPITALPYFMGVKFDSAGYWAIAGVMLLYAAILMGINWLWEKMQGYKKAPKGLSLERSYGLWFGAVFLVFLAIAGVIFKWDILTHPFFSHIHAACNPQNILSPYSGCENGFRQIMLSNPLPLLSSLFVPNLLILLCCLPELLRVFPLIINHPENRVKKQLGMEEIIDVLSSSFAHLKFYKKFNPNKGEFKQGAFAVLVQSREFVVKNRLILGFKKRQSSKDVLRMLNARPDPTPEDRAKLGRTGDYVPIIDEKKFNLICMEQLGGIWDGVESLSPEEMIVLSIISTQCLASNIDIKQVVPETFDGELWSLDAPDIEKYKSIIDCVRSEIDAIWTWLAKYTKADANGQPQSVPSLIKYDGYDRLKKRLEYNLQQPVMQEILSKHAYISTVIIAASIKSKTLGVLSPNNFRWMRMYNRNLFALLQNVGRPSVFAENMASINHFYSEQKQGRKLYRPDFQNAYNGLSERMTTFAFTEEDKRAYEKLVVASQQESKTTKRVYPAES